MRKLNFVNLHNHSELSLLDGMISPEELVNYAVENNQPGIAITDHGKMGGFFSMYKETEESNVKPLIGCEFYLVKDINFQQNKEKGEKEYRFHLTAIAKNEKGLENLFLLSTKAHLEGFYYRPRTNIEWVREHSEGVIFLSGCMAGVLGQLLLENKFKVALKQAEAFKNYFEDFYIEIQPCDIEDQVKMNPGLVKIGKKLDIPIVATADAHYLKEQKESHPVLLGINSGGEMWSFDDDCFHLMTGREMYELMRENHPKLKEKDIVDSVERTMEVYEKVGDYNIKRYKNTMPNPYPFLKNKDEEFAYLKKLCEKGWKIKGMEDKKELPKYKKRLNFELKQVKKLGFVRYFLLVHDLYENCVKPKDIMYGTGRGSSAGSLICCLLDITTPDPVKHGLIFERFISPNRVHEPDIDMDFEDKRREEIKEYCIEKYGREYVADIGTYGTMKGRQVLRDVCRVFDVPRKEVDKISQFIIQRSGGDARASNTIEDTFEEFDEAKRFAEKYPQILPHCKNLEGRLRQGGIHAAGVILSNMKLRKATPLELRGGQNGNITTALDWRQTDKQGFLKMDVLGLKTLSVIKDTIDQIGMDRKELVDVNYNNPKVLEVFNKGDTEGVFQFNSVGMADTLKELNVESFEDLVAMNALYRPGGMRSGICRDYIERRNGEQEVEDVNPIYNRITEDTQGLIVYQEQVMKIFSDMANRNAIEVHRMREKVAKSHGLQSMQAEKEGFIEGCVENDIDEKFAEELFEKIAHFGSYAFNRCIAGNSTLVIAAGNQYEPPEITIKDLYEKWKSKTPVGEKYRRQGVTILSLDSDGRARPKRVKKVYKTGIKPIYKITLENGQTIKSSKDHKYMTSKGEWKRLKQLKKGQKLLVKGKYENDKYNYSLSNKKQFQRKVNMEGHQGFYSGEKNPGYIDGSFIEYEKSKEIAYKRSEGKCEHCEAIENRMEYHHKDGDRTNNEPENIEYLCVSCHKKADYKLGRNKQWDKGHPIYTSKIKSIECVGKEQTYDLEMESDWENGHNYIANDIVVHNSHATVYTQIAYWTQWLKVYYPLEFYVASLNNEKDDDKVRKLLGQLEREGYRLLLPHINKSKSGFTVEEIDGEKCVRIGLRYIKGIGETTAAEIIKHQPYKDEKDIETREGIYRRVFHKGIRRLLRKVDAWKEMDNYEQDELEGLREFLAGEELLPLPILDKEIKKAKEMADNYDVEYCDIADLDFSRNSFQYIRGVFSGANYARIGDFGKPSKYSRWEVGDRYVMMDMEDGTAHIRVKFNPEKYEEYKDRLRIGNKVVIHGRLLKDIKMVFVDFMFVLSEEKIKEHKEKYGKE